jgi:histidyl-tRNA synthetase
MKLGMKLGMKALVPPAVAKWQFVEEHARGVLDAHCHREVRPPLAGDDGTLAPLAASYAQAVREKPTAVLPIARWYALGPVLHGGRERRRVAAALFGAAAATADGELRTLARTLLEQCGLEPRRLTLAEAEPSFTITLARDGPVELCRGGRADDLVAREGGPPTPAVGFVIDLDAVIAGLGDADEGYQPLVNVLVVARGEQAATPALEVARRLRASGIRTDFDHLGLSPDQNLARAGDQGVRLLAIVTGPRAPIDLVDVDTGDGEAVPPDDLEVRVAQLLD